MGGGGVVYGGRSTWWGILRPELEVLSEQIPLQNTTLQLKKEPQDLFIQAREMFFLAAWGGRTTASFRALMARDRPIIQRTLRRHRFPAPHVHAQKPAGTPIMGNRFMLYGLKTGQKTQTGAVRCSC